MGVCGQARRDDATAGGGLTNAATGEGATVSGGFVNIASGMSETVAGGVLNEAAGNHSFAAGHRAKAAHAGAFVWGDTTNEDSLISYRRVPSMPRRECWRSPTRNPSRD